VLTRKKTSTAGRIDAKSIERQGTKSRWSERSAQKEGQRSKKRKWNGAAMGGLWGAIAGATMNEVGGTNTWGDQKVCLMILDKVPRECSIHRKKGKKIDMPADRIVVRSVTS
jgi:hypothetical protein